VKWWWVEREITKVLSKFGIYVSKKQKQRKEGKKSQEEAGLEHLVEKRLTGGPANPAGPGGPASPRSPC